MDKTKISGMPQKLAYIHIAQHLLNYSIHCYEWVSNTICGDEWPDGKYKLASGLKLDIEDPDARDH
jgi:hypothetical protein